MKHKIVYERVYDNPKDKDGRAKPNKLLGKFKVINQLSDDMYAERFIGIRGGETYLITEHEVSGYHNPERGGSRYTVEKVDLGRLEL